MFSSLSQGRQSSPVVAWLSVLALVVAMVASTVAPAAASVDEGFQGGKWEDATGIDYDPKFFTGSLYNVATRTTGASDFWDAGYIGSGVDVALIDSGVVPVDGLTWPGKVVNGPDLSIESQSPDRIYLDSFGHGTHLAGIIAGRDLSVANISSAALTGLDSEFVGIAPGARIVNVKVGAFDGSVDVSQVIAAIEWVTLNRNSGDLDVRVLNLSYGTDGVQDYLIDPLSNAVQKAWEAGIVVVVAGGNDGLGSALRNPATNPYVIAVGASDSNSTPTNGNDSVASFSSCGDTDRHVDLVAPGRSLVSIKSPGSSADVDNPNSSVAGRYMLGSGSSQSAAIVSGAAALLLEQRPGLDPDQVKAILTSTAHAFSGVSEVCQGAGLLDLEAALTAPTPSANGVYQDFGESLPTGSLEAARGTHHLTQDGVVLQGEIDIFGNPWAPCTLLTRGKKTVVDCVDSLWDGGDYNGTSWSGTSWSGTSWSGLSWSGTSWSGTSWSGLSWSGLSWSGTSWSGLSWSGTSWSGTSLVWDVLVRDLVVRDIMEWRRMGCRFRTPLGLSYQERFDERRARNPSGLSFIV